MEQKPSLPEEYFDVVYSIYAIGWTTDLQTTFNNISSYLKKDGVFIFSWDHPFMHCVDAVDGQLIFSGSYFEKNAFTFKKKVHKPANRSNTDHSGDEGHPLTLYNRRVSDYINALSVAGFAVERVVEETDAETMKRDTEFSSEYYAACKAKHFPLSIIMKARKM
ncbi:MAG: methyltransferase domain-containing protein [Oscillospiraceae bacterium]|nr:methyltransferase domain-containing protein [Oscillospiraceae bacterium]MDD4413179.1 methyltransferase domain-containing protein [Oscillospiraceae bacterium]